MILHVLDVKPRNTRELLRQLKVFSILILLLRATRRFTKALEPKSSEGFMKMEKIWSLKVFRRMMMAAAFSSFISMMSHIFCIHLLLHGGLPCLGQIYHATDIAAELLALIFIVGILKPEMPDMKPQATSRQCQNAFTITYKTTC